MAVSNEQAWTFTQRAEKELQATLSEKDPTFRDIDHLLTQQARYRLQSEALIFQDFHFATEKNAEARLWDAHIKVNNRFRKQLGRFREGDGKKKPVEQRKVMKHYLDFIKSSQRFYRGYIQRLASHFGGIPEVEAVAHQLHVSDRATGNQTPVSAEWRQMISISCHQTLVRLGDLSRYRETELVTKERNWGPAIGYYDLAGAIYPTSGVSHNQLAVIALADGNHLRATYHLYRALAVEEPPPTAKGNLEIEFKKISAAWSKGELIAQGDQKDDQGPGQALVGWFMRLHARCYKGIEFAEHDELENEVLSQLAIDLKERSLEGTLNKFVLINIAAEYFAGVRLQDAPESPEALQAYLFFQRLNVSTFFTLLQILQPELERFAVDEDGMDEASSRNTDGSDRITAVARRVLPGLRHYSSWLVSNTAFLLAQVGDTSLTVQIKEMWKTYANTLTLLAATFPVSALPSVDYLLEEDEDSLGFKPFNNDRTKRRYFSPDDEKPKLKWHGSGVERHHPNVEMLGRVRDFLIDGLELSLDESTPIDLVEGTTTFTFREEGVPSELLASPNGCAATLSSTSVERQDIPEVTGTTAPDKVSMVDEGASQSATASVSMNTAMRRMVDNLVGEEEEMSSNDDYKILNGPQEITSPNPTLNDWVSQAPGNDTSYGMIETLTAQNLLQDLPSPSSAKHLYTTPRPILPSIYNTPFAPLPSDATPSPQSRPSTAKWAQGHSKQNSGNFSPLQQVPNGWSMHSSNISSMPDPSSMVFPHTPPDGHSAVFPPYLGNGTFGAGNAFVSSAVFNDSPWASGSAPNGTDSPMIHQDDKGAVANSGGNGGSPKRGSNSAANALRMCKRCRSDDFRSNNELHKHLKACKPRGRGRNVQATPPNGQGG